MDMCFLNLVIGITFKFQTTFKWNSNNFFKVYMSHLHHPPLSHIQVYMQHIQMDKHLKGKEKSPSRLSTTITVVKQF